MEKDYLIFKCASASRPSGQWKDNGVDVLADGVVVGRYRDVARPRGPPNFGFPHGGRSGAI